ncbi:MAG: hypothetical protein ACK4SO_06295 [Candidatus Kapaibacteriota bacterium]
MLRLAVDFIKRYGLLIIVALFSLSLVNLEKPEFRTFLLACLLECTAIAFSSFAAYVFTKVKFSEQPETPNLGLIFLGVHISFGLSLLALYLAQFMN